MMTENQIRERIENLKKELEVLENVLITEAKSRMGRPLRSYLYSEKQIEFLHENRELPMKELIKKYNKTFNTELSLDSRAIYNFMIRTGIIEPEYRRTSYAPQLPEAVEKSMKTKRDKFLKEVGINANKKD